MNQINRIIAYGCSWTAGTELMDHVHLNITFDQCNTIKRKYVGTNFSLEKMSNFNNDFQISKADSLNRENSWAAHLAKKLGKQFENRAEGGSGLDQQYLKIYSDYKAGLISKNDLVLIGLTDITRLVTFEHHDVSSLLLGHNLKINTASNMALLHITSNDWLVYNYYKTLKLILALSKEINIRLQPMKENIAVGDMPLKFVRNFALDVWEESQPIMLLPNEFLKKIEGVNDCGFFHRPVESHIDLADKIYASFNMDIKL